MTKEEIKQTYTMADIVARYGLEPNRSGFILCPFHQEKTASMKLYKNRYYCFSCGETGDQFDFVQRMESVSFKEAFRLLGGEYQDSFREYRRKKEFDRKQKRGQKEREGIQAQIAYHQLVVDACRELIQKEAPFSTVWCYCQNRMQYSLHMLDHYEREGR